MSRILPHQVGGSGMMWQMLNIAGASLIAVAAGALFGRNTVVLIVSPIIFGFAQAGLIWAANALTDGVHGWGALGQPLLLLPTMVAYITGLGFCVVLLAQHRKSRTPVFWLPDSETRGGEANWRLRNWASEPSVRRPANRPTPIVEIEPASAPAFRAPPPPIAAPAEVAPMAERPNKRRNTRRRAVLAGKMIMPGGIETRCTIRDLSQTGARVRLASSQPTPSAVTLVDLSNGIVHEAEVIWRDTCDLGLRFTGSTLMQRG